MSARDLHDSSREAVRERLAYWQRRAAVERAERGRAAGAAVGIGKLIGKAAPRAGDIPGAVRRPRAYARENPVPAAVLLFGGLVTLAVLRRGQFPDGRGMISIGAASLVVVLAASFAPDFVIAILGLALLVAVVESRDALRTVVELGTARFQQAVGG